MTDELACAQCPVRDRAACASLDERERAELARGGRRRDLAAGETLFAVGDDNATCATLVSGALKIVSTDPEGEEHILAKRLRQVLTSDSRPSDDVVYHPAFITKGATRMI